MVGLRNAIGDLAETLGWLIREVMKVDSAVVDLVGLKDPSKNNNMFS